MPGTIINPPSSCRGKHDRYLLIAAPASGSGKTTLTLGLLRAMRKRGEPVRAAKAGPDFIDPGFHELACGKTCMNLDPWGMQESRIENALSGSTSSLCLIEGMMGLFDGAADGTASAASLAKRGDVPVVLVVDAAKQSHSVAALVGGFRDHDVGVKIAGVILNRVGSDRHEGMLRNALQEIGMPVFGAVPRDARLEVPERHLGLVQISENREAERFIDEVSNVVAAHCDLDGLKNLFQQTGLDAKPGTRIGALGKHIAIAADEAFSFCYPHMTADWEAENLQVSRFSPLADEGPCEKADAVYLPGGYPELHAARLASSRNFLAGLCDARERGAIIYGECGGYMVLGKGLTDATGERHEMAGMLDLETSFATRKLHLGYRNLTATGFPMGDQLSAHEFHYSSALSENGSPLFVARDATGAKIGSVGLRNGNVMGSYMHVIDRIG